MTGIVKDHDIARLAFFQLFEHSGDDIVPGGRTIHNSVDILQRKAELPYEKVSDGANIIYRPPQALFAFYAENFVIVVDTYQQGMFVLAKGGNGENQGKKDKNEPLHAAEFKV